VFKSVRSPRGSKRQPEIQMTPLIDMIFILLIFFIVTTSFVTETGIPVERPRAASSESLPRQHVAVAVRADGQIVLEGQNIGLYAIRSHLERLLRNNPGLAAVIVADRLVSLDRIVPLMDEIRAAGVEDIALATEVKE
jgi:biopolymer transport protein ExbD